MSCERKAKEVIYTAKTKYEDSVRRVRMLGHVPHLNWNKVLNILGIMVVFLFEIQIDICAEELGNNVRPAATLLGDINAVTEQVT